MKNILKTNALFLILLFGLAIKAIYILSTDNKSLIYPDALDYDRIAMNLLREHKFTVIQTTPFFRAPLYPLFLFLIYLISPQNYLLVKIIQAILITLAAYLIFKIGKHVFSNEVGIISAGIFSFHPFFIIISSNILSEAVFIFLATLALYLLLKFAKNRKLTLLFLCGVVSGVSALTKPIFIIFLFLAILWFLCLKMNLKAILKSSFILLFSFFLIISPWIIRNYKVFHEFIYCNDAGGWSFWVSNSEDYYELLTTTNPQRYNYLNTRGIVIDKTAGQIKEFENKYNYKSLKPKEREKLWYRAAFDYIKNNKVQFVKLLFLRAWEYFRPYLDPRFYPKEYFLATLYINSAIYLFGISGLVLAYLSKVSRKESLFFILYFTLFAVMHAIYAANSRNRVAFIDPYLYIFSAYAFVELAKRLKLYLSIR